MRRRPMRATDRIGQRFGRWTVVGVGQMRPRPRHRAERFVQCRCECGTERLVRLGDLSSGSTRGCLACSVAERKQRARRCACGAPKNYKSRWCDSCRARRASIGHPRRYPVSIGLVAERAVLTRQRVHQLIGKLGWDGMVVYFRAKGVDVFAPASQEAAR